MSLHPDPASGDEALLRLLHGLQALEITASEVGVLTGIARFAQSGRILEFIAELPKWYARWEIREALYENPNTPAYLREALGMSIAVIDLIREMDSREIDEREREEIREDIRSLLRQLPPVDHEVVKAHARALAAGPKPASTAAPIEPTTAPAETGQAETEAAAEAAAERELAASATTATSPAVLLDLLLDRHESVRRAAIENPNLDESTLVAAATAASFTAALFEIATTPRWSFRDPVRRAVLANPHSPPAILALFGVTEGLLLAFMRYFNHPLEPDERAALAKNIMAEIQELPPPEREYLKFRVGPAWKPFIGEVMRHIEDEFRTLRPTPVTTAWPAAPEAAPAPEPDRTTMRPRGGESTFSPSPSGPAPAAAMDTFDQQRHAPAPLHRQAVSAETRSHLAALPVEERRAIAAGTRNRDELAFLLHDPDDRVFAALLDNPALGEEEIVTAAKAAAKERVRYLTESRRAYALLGVKRALLHNPHAGERVQLECLNHAGNIRELSAVMRDPKVRSPEVKAKARARLVERYRAMGSEERVAALKQSGGDLLNDLRAEAFADERTLLRLVGDSGADEGLVLKVVRSRTAPRAVLAAVAREPRFVNHYQVRLELVMNPKTPREVVAQLIAKLSPQDRQRLRAAGDVADAVRDLA